MPAISTSAINTFLQAADAAAGRAAIDAVGTASEITTALQGTEADPTKIGSEYMPESLSPVVIGLDDTSALTLPLGTLGADDNGNPVVHDGVTLGGNAIGTPNTKEFEGSIVLAEADMDATNITTIGVIPVTVANAALGKKLRMRGRVWVLNKGVAPAAMRIGFRATPLPPAAYSQLTGIGAVLSENDADKVQTFDIDKCSVLTDSSGLLLFSASANDQPDAIATYYSAGVLIQSAVNGGESTSNKLTPATATTLTVFFITSANASSTGTRMYYNLKFSWE